MNYKCSFCECETSNNEINFDFLNLGYDICYDCLKEKDVINQLFQDLKLVNADLQSQLRILKNDTTRAKDFLEKAFDAYQQGDKFNFATLFGQACGLLP